jgi:DNA repair exonuclease SbcCD ATPase subunit
MNTKIGIAILAVVCAGLAVALVVIKGQADKQQTASASTIGDFSNQLVKAAGSIEDLKQANLTLNNDLATNRQVSLALSNQLASQLVSLSAQLADATGSLATATASLQGAQQQISTLNGSITNLNEQITDLEAKNQALDQRASSLSNTIVSLDSQIAATQLKLASSETNNAFLDGELKRQIAQRTELERKFNDLVVVRAQVTKLRDDLIAAQRLEWMREGIDPANPLKGGQLLMQHTPFTNHAVSAAGSPAYNLNVEVGSDGSVHVIPPPTNAPAH